MSRIATRRAKQARDAWAAALTDVRPADQVTRTGPDPSGRGVDYTDAPAMWACNRKKAYSSREFAEVVGSKMNEYNRDPSSQFAGVVVVPYACRRCGHWHLGR